MNTKQLMPNAMPFGLSGFPEIDRVDAVRHIVYFKAGDSAPITNYLAGGEECGNPLRADTLVAGPYKGKWLVLPVRDGVL